MSEEMNEKKTCTCTECHKFCKMIFASFLGCVLALIVVGAFAKPPIMSPCPCGCHKMHKSMIMPPPAMDNQHPFERPEK